MKKIITCIWFVFIHFLKNYHLWLWASAMLLLFAYHKIGFETLVSCYLFMIVVLVGRNQIKLNDMVEIKEKQVPKFKKNDFVYCAMMTNSNNLCYLCFGKIIDIYICEASIKYHIMNNKKNLMEVDKKNIYRTQEEVFEVVKQFLNEQINHA